MSGRGGNDPRFFAVLLGLLGLSATVALAAPNLARAFALPGSAQAFALPGSAQDGPTCRVSGVDCARKPSPNPKRWPRIATDPWQPIVAATTSRLTGSKVTISGLRLEGIVDLPTADGTLTALKVSMDQAVTDNFLLRTPGPDGRTILFATERLTVRGDVAFYTTRLVGRLPGVKITLAPDLPIPEGIPMTSPIPITLTDPIINLAFLNGDVLTARPKLKFTLD